MNILVTGVAGSIESYTHVELLQILFSKNLTEFYLDALRKLSRNPERYTG